MGDRMDDHLIQEPRIRRARRRPAVPTPRPEDPPHAPAPRRPAREETTGD